MCGRFSLISDLTTICRRFAVEWSDASFTARYNVCPTQPMPVIFHDGQRRLTLMQWGLIPHWSKELPKGSGLINARVESVASKPSFSSSYRNKRCLVPADGFYEWQRNPYTNEKKPFRICRKDGKLFALAGLWDEWHSADSSTILTFTILTQPATPLLANIHDRMPILLSKEAEASWLNPTLSRPTDLEPLLTPYPDTLIETYPISNHINSPAHDDPECIH